MTPIPRRPRIQGWIAPWIGTGALLGLTGCALPTASKGHEGDGELWQLSVDNDSYNFDDGNYTNGVELLWVSAPTSGYPAESRSRQHSRRISRRRGLVRAFRLVCRASATWNSRN